MDADGLWKAVDGFEAQQERIRPQLPTSPWKTGKRTPVSHSAHRPSASRVSTRRRSGLHPALIRRPPPAIVASLRRVITISGIGDHDPGLGDHDQRITHWSPGRDGKTRDEGYVPSECQPKRWPTKALSGVWRPRRSGGRNNGFELGGAYVRTARHSTNAGVTLTASPAGSGARRRGSLASATIRPLLEAARAAG